MVEEWENAGLLSIIMDKVFPINPIIMNAVSKINLQCNMCFIKRNNTC